MFSLVDIISCILQMYQPYPCSVSRDNEALRQWRGETKQLQNEKYREAYIYGGAKNPVNVAKQSPYDVSNDHMKLPTNEERIAVIIVAS